MILNPFYQTLNDNFNIFFEEVLGYKNAEFQDDLDKILSDPIYKKIAIAIARDHGKSTHLSIGYPLWEIARNHELRIIVVSSTATIASTFLTQIINNIDSNEKYQDFAKSIDPKGIGVIPKMRTRNKREEKWASNSFTIERNSLNLKDPTILATGLFGSILSKRADIIIVDDLVNQQNSETEEQRQKIKDWVYTTLLPVLVPGGRFIYLGNTWHQDDLVANLLVDPQFDYTKKIPAILHEPIHMDLWSSWADIVKNQSIEIHIRKQMADDYYLDHQESMNEGLKVLWPERYNYGDLFLKRQANSYSFARMYQCDPSDRPDQKFKEEWLQAALAKGRHLRLQEEAREGISIEVGAAGLDLAIKEDETGDDSSILTLDRVRYGDGVIKQGDYVVRNIKRGKWSPNKVKEETQITWNVGKPISIRVESNGYQEMMARDLDEKGVLVSSYHTGGEKMDPDIGVNSLAILLENGRLILPFDLEDSRTVEEVSKLVNGMRAYPQGHTDDSLMALWFAFSEIRDRVGERYTVPSILSTPGLSTQGSQPDISNPEVRKEEEKKVDLALTMEQEAERQAFWGMMRRRM